MERAVGMGENAVANCNSKSMSRIQKYMPINLYSSLIQISTMAIVMGK
jgi:hypothetical protein